MSNIKIDSKFLNKIRQAAIRATPKDTGNLAYNALVVSETPKGFSVMYQSSVAGYGVFLNDYRKTKGFGPGGKNKHYLWFDSGVHKNVVNEMLRTLGNKKPSKPDTVIEPTQRTFQGSSIERRSGSNNSKTFLKESNVETLQHQTFKQWNSRYDQFKNHNEKGWGI